MNLTKLSLKRPVSAVLLVLMVIIFGISSYDNLEQELTPELSMPVLMVSTSYPGANPEDVEEMITSVIENQVSTLSEVKNVTTQSSEGRSMVMVQFAYGTDISEKYDDLKKKLDNVSRMLPSSAGNPMIMEMAIDDTATMQITVSGEAPGGLYNYVENNLIPELEKQSGVASVSSYGGSREYVSVTLHRDMMEQYGLTMNSVASAINSASFSSPAGSVDVGKLTLSVTSGMSYDTMDSLNDIPITLGSGNVITLRDVATVYKATRSSGNQSAYDGKETINISISKQQSATAQKVSSSIHSLMDKMEKKIPSTVNVEITYDAYTSIKSSLDSVLHTLVIAVLISMTILFLFFGDLKASLIVASSMPVSVLVAIIMMRFFDFSLNIISMAALVVGVGMMVDNSIVVLESCFRHREAGAGLFDAALEGTKEVTASIIAGTVTSVVVYVPLAIITGMVGQLFKPLGFVIVFALLASLLSAMTIVPLAYYFYHPVEREKAPLAKAVKALAGLYERFLHKSIYKKKTVVLITVLIVIAAFMSVSNLKMELMPAGDEGTIRVSVTTRPGTRSEEQQKIVKEVEKIIVANENLAHYSQRGNSFTIELKEDRTQSTQDIINDWKDSMRTIVNCDINISNASAMQSYSRAMDELQFRLTGTDYGELKETAQNITNMLNSRSDVALATSSLTSAAPIIKIEIDPIRAAAEGFTPVQIASSVSALMNGTQAGNIREDGEELSVTVEYPKESYRNIEDIQGITLTNNRGSSVPLCDVADLVYKDSPRTISKRDGYYNMTITVEIRQATLMQSRMDITKLMNTYVLPDSVSFGMNTMDQQMNDEFRTLYEAIATAIFLVFMVMAMQFESPRFSLMVMVCIPFSFVGAFLVLNLTGTSLSMTSLMGFLMLIGTVVNSGILYVDTVNQNRTIHGMKPEAAMVQAGVTRLRPILMTSSTTILSLSPLAVGFGKNSEMMQGFAVVAIGGMVVSTLLALLLLPTYYNIMRKKDPDEKKRRKLFGKKQPADSDATAVEDADYAEESAVEPEITENDTDATEGGETHA